MGTPIQGLLWVEKFRPESLDEMALNEDNRELFQQYIDRGEIPHLLLHGPAGCGKTTVSKILAEELDCQLLTLNASSERGIDTIRDKIRTFARGMTRSDWNLVFMDEADATTRDAQTAMRNLMETFSQQSRFILTANYPHKIIDPIRSRCVEIGMSEIPLKQRAKTLRKVLEAEGIQADPQTIISYAERYTDLRRLLTQAQKSYLSNGELRPATDTAITPKEIFEAIKAGNERRLKEIVKSPDFDPQAGLNDLFWYIPDDYKRSATFRAILDRALTDMSLTPDQRLHALGTFSKLITEV